MRKRSDGLTLVELMVVVLIIGILVAVAVPVFRAAKSSAEKNTCQANQRTWAGVVQQARANNEEPAATIEAVKTLASGTGNSAWYGVAGTYLKSVPVCPTSKRAYWVYEAPPGTSRNGEIAGCDGEVEPTWADSEHPLASVGSGNVIVFNGLIYKIITAEDGKQWLDRNLGATQVANFPTDYLAYGWLYQWGRASDGHQLRTSGSTAGPSASSQVASPNDTKFLTGSSATRWDWMWPRQESNDFRLWQGIDGVNNPCPQGFRLPTSAEWEDWVLAAGSDNVRTFNTSLKLPLTGYRVYSSGSLGREGSYGYYWSSSYVGDTSLSLSWDSSSVYYGGHNWRAYGFSVRPIKN